MFPKKCVGLGFRNSAESPNSMGITSCQPLSRFFGSEEETYFD